jgi:hypothetical protein
VGIAGHITTVGQEARLLAEAAEHSGLDVDIPTCPGWDMRELLCHLSETHLWAAALVAQRTMKLWPDDISEHTSEGFRHKCLRPCGYWVLASSVWGFAHVPGTGLRRPSLRVR